MAMAKASVDARISVHKERGLKKELRIYHRLLTPEEVRKHRRRNSGSVNYITPRYAVAVLQFRTATSDWRPVPEVYEDFIDEAQKFS